MKLRIPRVKVKTAAFVVILLQGLGSAALAGYMILQSAAPPEPPEAAFVALRTQIVEHGVESALDDIGGKVWTAGDLACRRDACIRDRFKNDRARFEMHAPELREKMCAPYKTAECPKVAVRMALKKVLEPLAQCKVLDTQVVGERARLKVACAQGSTDFIHLDRSALGWRFSGEEAYPGFLPRLYAVQVSRDR